MTGRTLHDALLRVLTRAELRHRTVAGDEAGLGAVIGLAEARVLCRADPERLRRLARFLGRHFYRERIVRLFVASRRLALPEGADPLAVLARAAFATLLDAADVGSAATADAVATQVEAVLRPALGDCPFGADLVAYEGLLFRTEAGPRRWTAPPTAGVLPKSATAASIIELAWDVTGLVAAARRGDAMLPAPPRRPTRLLAALSLDGRVTAVRCPDAVVALLGKLDGTRSVGELAGQLGVEDAQVSRLLRELTGIGAVEWAATSPPPSSRASGSRP